MLKHLAAMGTVQELDVDKFGPTSFSEALTKEIYQDSCLYLYDRSSFPSPITQPTSKERHCDRD